MFSPMSSPQKLTRLCTGVYRDFATGQITLNPAEMLQEAGHALTPDTLAWADRLLREVLASAGYAIEPAASAGAEVPQIKEVAHA